MRVLIDQVIHSMRNKGNVALLQVALHRLARIFPGARLDVLTDAPHLLYFYAPMANAVLSGRSGGWLREGTLAAALHRMIPTGLLRCLLELREVARGWQRVQDSRDQAASSAGRPEPVSPEQPAGRLLEAVRQADMVVTTGGGYLSDYDKPHLMRTLDLLEYAAQLGKPTAMLGQGVGSIEDTDLLDRLRQVLPLVDLILVRERQVTPRLLRSLGVAVERIAMTGDDGVELAFAERRAKPGSGIGVSIRIARYTEVQPAHLASLRPVLRQAAERHGARLTAVPISVDGSERDDVRLSSLINGEAASPARWRRFATPRDLARVVGGCRIMVAGAFHAAGFALAQGIPVVALARSLEYYHKFMGLREEFGPACHIVTLEGGEFPGRVAEAIETAWEEAPQARPALLEAAARQCRLGESGYRRLRGLVEAKAGASGLCGWKAAVEA